MSLWMWRKPREKLVQDTYEDTETVVRCAVGVTDVGVGLP